jgi:DNA-binding transcriptional regulator/RsmH inhibitor MraZ
VERCLAGSSLLVELDAAGRLLLPSRWLEATGIVREVTLVGRLDWFEIWDHARFVGAVLDGPASGVAS